MNLICEFHTKIGKNAMKGEKMRRNKGMYEKMWENPEEYEDNTGK